MSSSVATEHFESGIIPFGTQGVRPESSEQLHKGCRHPVNNANLRIIVFKTGQRSQLPVLMTSPHYVMDKDRCCMGTQHPRLIRALHAVCGKQELHRKLYLKNRCRTGDKLSPYLADSNVSEELTAPTSEQNSYSTLKTEATYS
jgi:hypothetical protein